MKRQLPRWSELRPLMQFKPLKFNRTAARVSATADIWDLRRIAKSTTPKAAFDYADGAAGQEHSLRCARKSYANVVFQPTVLKDVSQPDLSTSIAGAHSNLPFGIAPTGFTRFMHAAGEIAGIRAAHKAGIPFTLSTMGTTTIERLAETETGARRWFQLYLWKDRAKSEALVRRAQDSGYDTLMVTVDTAVAGLRLRDVRNGMSIPPALTLKTVFDAGLHPQWWFNFLTTEPLTFATLSDHSGSIAELINSMFDPTITFDDIQWLRSVWPGKLFVKGVQNSTDAAKLANLGVDGLVVSNHGGRQLDRAPAPLSILPAIRSAVGADIELILDSGIMSGGDIVAALAAGADFTLVGRAYLYGLMAGGQAGVEQAIHLLSSEIQVTMQLLGTTTINDLTPEHINTLCQHQTISVPSKQHMTANSPLTQ